MEEKQPVSSSAAIPEPSESRKANPQSKLQMDSWIEKLREFNCRCADCQNELIVKTSVPRAKEFLLQIWSGYRCSKCLKEIKIAGVFSDSLIAQSYLDHSSIQQEVSSILPDWKFYLKDSGLGYLANTCPSCGTVQADYYVYAWIRERLTAGGKPEFEKWIQYSGEWLDSQESTVQREIIFPFVVADSFPLCPQCHAVYLKKKENGEHITFKKLQTPVQPNIEADAGAPETSGVHEQAQVTKAEMPPLIYHFATWPDWEARTQEGGYGREILIRKGYIPFCSAADVGRLSSVKFRGIDNLMLVVVDKGRLLPKISYDIDDLGAESPHVLGPVNLDAVVATFKLTWKEEKGEHVIVRNPAAASQQTPPSSASAATIHPNNDASLVNLSKEPSGEEQ